MPKSKDIRHAALVKPPMKSCLFEAIKEEMQKKAEFANITFAVEKHTQVDQKWLIELLSTINDQHRYFERGYRPEPKEKVEKPKEEITIDDPIGFFAGLHAPKRALKKKGRNLFVSKSYKEEVKLQRLEQKGQLMMAKLQKMREELEAKQARDGPVGIQFSSHANANDNQSAQQNVINSMSDQQ